MASALLRPRGGGLAELAGVAVAVAICQLAAYGFRRWQESGEAERRASESEARISELVSLLQLSPHPEGGFYRRVHESAWRLAEERCMARADGSRPVARSSSAAAVSASDPSAPPAFHFPRPLATSIYFLLSAAHPLSHLHRLASEEQWNFLEGDPLLIVQVDPVTGEYSERLLGPIKRREEVLDSSALAHPNRAFLQPCSTAPSPAAAAHVCSSAFPTHVVPGGVWFGARLCDPARFEAPRTNGAAAASGHFSLLSATEATPAAASPAPLRRFGYTLVSCVVSPGFQFDDFELMGSAQFDALRVAEQLQQRMQQAKPADQAIKLAETREMVLAEKLRGQAMEAEASLSSSSLISKD